MEGQASVWLIVAAGTILVLVLRLRAAHQAATDAHERANRDLTQFQVQAQERLERAVAPLQTEIKELSGRVEDRARAQFGEWRQNEIDGIRRQELDSARREAHVLLAGWKAEAEV